MTGFSPLRRRMIEDITLHNLSPATHFSSAVLNELLRKLPDSPMIFKVMPIQSRPVIKSARCENPHRPDRVLPACS